MSKPIYVKGWKDLKNVESDTHIIEVDLRFGSAWIKPKEEKIDDGLGGCMYLSTHTFYESNYKESTEILQSCGFNVDLANWG